MAGKTTKKEDALLNAFSHIKEDEAMRFRFTQLLKELKEASAMGGIDVRDSIIGPILDILYSETDVVTKELNSGVKISCEYRSKIAREFLLGDECPDHVWEPQTTKLLLKLGKTTRNAIVGGAYFGDQAIPLAFAIKSHGGVCHCFEIVPEQVQSLKTNILNNDLDNVEVNEMGLWNKAGVEITLTGDDAYASPREAKKGSSTTPSFPVTTIDEYGKTHDIENVDLIMLDIEGGELAALQGAASYISKDALAAPVIIFEIHSMYTDWSRGLENTEIVRFLEEHGYTVFAIRDYQGHVPMGDRPVEIIPVREAYIEGPPHGFNMFATKNPSIVKKFGLEECTEVSPKLLFHRDPALHQPLH